MSRMHSVVCACVFICATCYMWGSAVTSLGMVPVVLVVVFFFAFRTCSVWNRKLGLMGGPT